MDANHDLVNTSQDALLDGLSILLNKNEHPYNTTSHSVNLHAKSFTQMKNRIFPSFHVVKGYKGSHLTFHLFRQQHSKIPIL